MAVDFKSSETKENLMRAFAGESQARNRYTFAADLAHKQKLHSVECLFTFTANQEKAHAEIYYNHLKEMSGENIEITAAYPVNISQCLEDLLTSAQHNEYEEATDAYVKFSEKAKEEGFPQIAYSFAQIAKIEQIHGDRFGRVADLIKNNELYSSSVGDNYICLNCGYIFEGKEVPAVCPVCQYDQGYFVPIQLLSSKEFLAGIK